MQLLVCGTLSQHNRVYIFFLRLPHSVETSTTDQLRFDHCTRSAATAVNVKCATMCVVNRAHCELCTQCVHLEALGLCSWWQASQAKAHQQFIVMAPPPHHHPPLFIRAIIGPTHPAHPPSVTPDDATATSGMLCILCIDTLIAMDWTPVYIEVYTICQLLALLSGLHCSVPPRQLS